MSTNAYSDDMKTLAEGFGQNSKASNRLWLFLAGLTLVVSGNLLGGIPLQGSISQPITLLGTSVSPVVFVWLATIVFSLGNLAYASAHLQAYRAGKIYQEYLAIIETDQRDLAGNPWVEGRTRMLEAAHMLYAPNLNRLFPLTHAVGNWRAGQITLAVLKFLTDAIYSLTPLTGLVMCYLAAVGQVEAAPTTTSLALLTAATAVLIVSLIGTALLLVTAFRWDVDAFRRAVRRM